MISVAHRSTTWGALAVLAALCAQTLTSPAMAQSLNTPIPPRSESYARPPAIPGWLLPQVNGASPSLVYAESPNTLYAMEPFSWQLHDFAAPETTLTDIAITPDGTVYGIDFFGLYRVDPLTGTATRIPSNFPTSMNALVSAPDGTLHRKPCEHGAAPDDGLARPGFPGAI